MKINGFMPSFGLQQPVQKNTATPQEPETQTSQPSAKTHVKQLSSLLNPLASQGASNSANFEAPTLPTPEEIKTAVQEWKAKFDSRGKSEELRQRIEDNFEAYQSLLDKAAQEGGYDYPETFVKSLSEEELAVLQAMKNFAQPINPAELDKEGSLNLLLPPNAAIDLDQDGSVTIGTMKRMFTFPPNQAPQSVKQAWEKATEDLSAPEIILAQANFKYFQGFFNPTYLPADTDYAKLSEDIIAYIEKTRLLAFDSIESDKVRQRNIDVFKRFIAELK